MPTARGWQELYYNDVPFGDMLFEGKSVGENTQDTGSLMDTSINNAVFEYGFPVEFFLDMLCRYIRCHKEPVLLSRGVTNGKGRHCY